MGSHVAPASGFYSFLKLALFHYDVPVRGFAGCPHFMSSSSRVLLDPTFTCISLHASRLS